MRLGSSPFGHDARPLKSRGVSLCAGLLLIATSVQAITPDHDDLASSRAFRILLQERNLSRFWQDEEAMQGGLYSDVATAPDSAMRHRSGSVRAGGFAPIVSEPREPSMMASGARHSRTGSPGRLPLIILLCHLTC